MRDPDIVPRQRKRVRIDTSAPKDKFNLSNDQYYEVSKEKSRVRQTFGQIIVEHAYPAQKLQLPFVCWTRFVGAVSLINSSFIVQDTTVQRRSSVIPSSRNAVSS